MVLKIYSLLLISSSFSRILATCFYAVKNTWYPALCCVLYVLFHWLFTPYMIQKFYLPGLIFATTISNVFFMLILTGAYPFFVGSLYLFKTFKKVLHSLPALGVLSLHLHFSFDFFTKIFHQILGKDSAFSSTLSLILVIALSMILYLGAGLLLRLSPAQAFLRLINKKR